MRFYRKIYRYKSDSNPCVKLFTEHLRHWITHREIERDRDTHNTQ